MQTKARILSITLAAGLLLLGFSLQSAWAQSTPDLKLPAGPLEADYEVQATGGDAFYHAVLSGAGSGYDIADGAAYLAWCIDPYTAPDEASTVEAFSSYAPDLPEDIRLHRGRTIPWDQVNWILNHKQGQPNNVLNAAIWFLITGERALADDPAWDCPAGGECDELAGQAAEEGAGFLPQAGQVAAVILRANGIDQEDDGAQDTIIEVEVPAAAAIDIRKGTLEGPDSRSAPFGADVTFEIAVTNTGNTDLTGVEVTDELAPGCARLIGDLAAGASLEYTCTAPSVRQDLDNEACASGQAGEVRVEDCDTSTLVVDTYAVDLRKQAEGPDSRFFETRSDVPFEIVVTNIGEVDLEQVEVTDALAPGCSQVIEGLAVGASASYACTARTVYRPFNNVACAGLQAGGLRVEDCDESFVDTDYEVYFPLTIGQ